MSMLLIAGEPVGSDTWNFVKRMSNGGLQNVREASAATVESEANLEARRIVERAHRLTNGKVRGSIHDFSKHRDIPGV